MVLVEDNLEYEINEKGERMLIRSLEFTKRVHLRFRNMTRRDVSVLWLDYQGNRKSYVTLPPWSMANIDTYATHPWIFEDCVTRERYVINNRKVFYPPENQPTHYRTLWNITIGVRTLKHTALLTITSLLKDPRHSLELDLPQSLAEELKNMIQLFQVRIIRENSER